MTPADHGEIADALVVVDVQRGLASGPDAVADATTFLERWRLAIARGLTVVLPRDGHTTYDARSDGDAPAVPAALELSNLAELVNPS